MGETRSSPGNVKSVHEEPSGIGRSVRCKWKICQNQRSSQVVELLVKRQIHCDDSY